jgi:hypothetical protein
VSVTLPPLLERLVAAINGGDTAAFVASLVPDAVVDDWGKRYVGLDAVRRWNDRELIGITEAPSA